MTFIREIVSEIQEPRTSQALAGTPSTGDGDEKFEELVDRVTEAVLQRLAERWQE